MGFIDWMQGLSAFADGLIGRIILCKGKYLLGFVVVCRWSGFCSATSFSYAGREGGILSLTPFLFNLRLPRVCSQSSQMLSSSSNREVDCIRCRKH